MQYIQATFNLIRAEEYQKDLLIAELADIGFSTFEDIPEGFAAYTDKASFDRGRLDETLESFKDFLEFDCRITELEGRNWNEEWESNFEPLIISDQCYVRATFHQPQDQYPYEIVIDPKMAFGTGHHQTTTMMMEYILETDMKGRAVLDMGCGTGILAILAAKRGADRVTAIDYDEVCYESTLENCALNGTDQISALCGSKEAIPAAIFDIVLANINRNILLDQIQVYSKVMTSGGDIFFSGFYEHPDLDMILEECEKYGLRYADHKKKGEWVAAHFRKAEYICL